MSIHHENGKWRVKWRVNGEQRSKTLDLKSDARRFDAEVRRHKQLGPVLAAELDRKTMTLGEFVRGPWQDHAATLSEPTRAKYKWALEKHLTPLRNELLLTLDVPVLSRHQRVMLEYGATASTIREVMARLSGILQVAAEHGLVSGNAARSLRKVKADPRPQIVPVSPVELERLVSAAEGRDRIIYLLGGHLGLRPLEARLIRWSAFNGEFMLIGEAQTKRSSMRSRVVAVPQATAKHLEEWRLACGQSEDDQPILGEMSANALRLWGSKKLRPAVERVTHGRVGDGKLYTLRHTHASMVHYCGFTVPEAAKRLGHGPALHLRTYAHVIEAITGQRYDDLDALIDAARAELACPISGSTLPALDPGADVGRVGAPGPEVLGLPR